MTREQALEVAKANRKAYGAAQIRFTFDVWAVMTDIVAREQAQRDLDAQYGYKHGWYKVGEFCFCDEEITGEKYDHTQGGWAFI